MTGFGTVCVAAVQATPVILDADATIDKAIDLLGEAAEGGATLVVLVNWRANPWRSFVEGWPRLVSTG